MPSGRTVLAGGGPLLWLLAAQILRAGGKLDAILDTTPRAQLAARARRICRTSSLSPYFAKGLKLLREVPRQGAGRSERRSRSRPWATTGCARSCSARRRRTADAGRSPAAAPGRRAQRQPRRSRPACAHRLERAPALLRAGAGRRFRELGARHRRGRRRRGHRRRHGGGRARAARGASRPCARSKPERSACRDRRPIRQKPAARGDGPRLPRLALSSRRRVPPARRATRSSAAARR